jgi:hypothetical protein
MTHRILLTLAVVFAPTLSAQQQEADNAFDMSVKKPAHTTRHPVLAIDEAHNNFHTATGRYAPFAKLMRNDGLVVRESKSAFSEKSLQGIDVLVISNAVAPGVAAGGATRATATSAPVFTESECDAVRDWVRAGGALLLISDHAPFGSAAEVMAMRFDVKFGKGFVLDRNSMLADAGPSAIVFEGDRLGKHAIFQGRDSTERVRRVVSFTGQSLSIPDEATGLLLLSKTATEAASREDVAAGNGVPVAGRAQGIAMQLGRGRVVVLGEAAMMTAQLAGGGRPSADGGRFKMGMNHEGSDDKQFALNVVRWLTGELK